MKIVVLDGYTENPGDISWAPLEKLGEVTVYDRTAYEESPLIAERLGDADIAVINKTPISKETIDKCPNLKGIAVLATGYNVVDYDYAKEKGIPVMNVPVYGTVTYLSSLYPFCLRFAPISDITVIPYMLVSGQAMLTGATGTIR